MITTKNRLVILALSIVVAVVAMFFGYGKIDSNETESNKIEKLENYFLASLTSESFYRASKMDENPLEFSYTCNGQSGRCEAGDDQNSFEIFLKALKCNANDISKFNTWVMSDSILKRKCGDYDITVKSMPKSQSNQRTAYIIIKTN